MSNCTYEGCASDEATHAHADGIILCDEHQGVYLGARDQALRAGGIFLRNLLVEYERAKHGAVMPLGLAESPQEPSK